MLRIPSQIKSPPRRLSLLALLFLLGCSPATARPAGYSTATGKRNETQTTKSEPAPASSNPTTRTIPAAAEAASPPPPLALEETSKAQASRKDRPLPHDNDLVELSDPHGAWLVTCSSSPQTRPEPPQDPRRIDSTPELIFHSLQAATPASTPENLGQILHSSADGRFLAYANIQNEWRLFDTRAQKDISLEPLQPDKRSDGRANHRSIAFSDDSRYLFLTQRAPRNTIIVKDLRQLPNVSAQGQPASSLQPSALLEGWKKIERPSQLPIWRIIPRGSLLEIHTLSGPRQEANWLSSTTTPRRCRHSSQSWSPAPHTNTLRPPIGVDHEIAGPFSLARGWQARPAPGLVYAFQERWLRRHDDGQLSIVEGSRSKKLTSSNCGARIIGADLRKNAWLVSCEELHWDKKKTKRSRKKKPRYRFDLYVVGHPPVRSLHLEMAKAGIDAFPQAQSRYLTVRAGADHVVVDLWKKSSRALEKKAQIIAISDQGLLLRRSQAIFWQTDQGKETRLGASPAFSRIEGRRSWAIVGDIAYQLPTAAQELPGRYQLPEVPATLTDLGWVYYFDRSEKKWKSTQVQTGAKLN
ncbi:MAG: hypothetical protein MK135_15095 [Polyangiaceae bacterium]|nr:hypothetical protein [Polyangiaceae bacterium]